MKDAIEEIRKSKAVGVGRVLADVRKTSGLSQAALADRLGASISYVTRLEAGVRGADLADIVVWCRTCGVPVRSALAAIAGESEPTGNAAVEVAATLRPELLGPSARLLATLAELVPADVDVLQGLAAHLLEARGARIRT